MVLFPCMSRSASSSLDMTNFSSSHGIDACLSRCFAFLQLRREPSKLVLGLPPELTIADASWTNIQRWSSVARMYNNWMACRSKKTHVSSSAGSIREVSTEFSVDLKRKGGCLSSRTPIWMTFVEAFLLQSKSSCRFWDVRDVIGCCGSSNSVLHRALPRWAL